MSSTPASDSLRAEHRRIENHLDRLLAILKLLSPARVPEVRREFEEIRRLALPHFRREEEIYYPRLRNAIPELLARMDEQHQYTRELEKLLEELLKAPPSSLEPPRMAELRRYGMEFHDSVQHHIVEEEEYLMRIADSELSAEEQGTLAREMSRI